MPSDEAQPGYKPSDGAVAILCERLQRMGVSISEPAARSLLESVLSVEGPRLDAQARGTLLASLEAVRKATDAAVRSLTGAQAEVPRRDYELSFPPVSEPVSVSGQRRRVPAPRPVVRKEEREEDGDKEPRPVFKRRRGR
jgi:hypothetical protein